MTKIRHKPALTGLSLVSFLVVVATHAAVLYGLWHHRFSTTTPDTITLYAQFIAPLKNRKKLPKHPRWN